MHIHKSDWCFYNGSAHLNIQHRHFLRENEYQCIKIPFMCVFAVQWAEYILFAALLVVVCFIFAIMAYFYTYIDPARIEAQFTELDPEDKERKRSLEMEMSRKDSVASSKGSRRGSHVPEKQSRM